MNAAPTKKRRANELEEKFMKPVTETNGKYCSPRVTKSDCMCSTCVLVRERNALKDNAATQRARLTAYGEQVAALRADNAALRGLLMRAGEHLLHGSATDVARLGLVDKIREVMARTPADGLIKGWRANL